MEEIKLEINSLDDTKDLAYKIGSIVEEGDVILFKGVVGAGKTTFIQFLANSLGIKERITSPTFVIHMLRTSGRIPLSHVDLYRLDDESKVESIGFEDYYDSSVTVIEWSERYSKFKAPYLEMIFECLEDENKRIVTLRPVGKGWEKKLKEIGLNE